MRCKWIAEYLREYQVQIQNGLMLKLMTRNIQPFNIGPTSNMLVIHVDATWDERRKVSDFGVVIRNYEGEVIVAMKGNCPF